MLDGRRAVMKTLSSRAKRFPKILFALSRCRIPKAKSSRDLLSRSSVQAGAWDGECYGGGAGARRNSSSFRCNFGGGRWIIYI
jgi:hypothetical protein